LPIERFRGAIGGIIEAVRLNVASTFYYLCTVLDGFSRFIVAWDVRRAMQEADAEIVLQRWPGDVGDADTLFDDVAAPPPGTSRGCSGSGRRISPRAIDFRSIQQAIDCPILATSFGKRSTSRIYKRTTDENGR
jgi:hypothetical protein